MGTAPAERAPRPISPSPPAVRHSPSRLAPVQTGVGGPAKVVVGGDAAKTGGVVKLSLDDTMDDF